MSTPATKLIDDINTYLSHPAALQQAVLDFTRSATNGQYDYVDPTNPVVNAIESAVLTSAATINSYKSILRQQYAILAQDWNDLFKHMSDKDYLDRFSVPSKTTFELMFRKSEIINKMVFDPASGYSKITIPRNTFFKIADTVFSIQYPIEIRQLSHGGLQIVYDTEITSPVQELSTNSIVWDERQDNQGNRFIHFSIEVIQLEITTSTYDLNSATRFSTNIELENDFYFARIYLRNDNGKWDEVKTTHSDVVYDPNLFTATLAVTDEYVTVSVPEIYTANATNNRKMRIDIYQTKGPITMMLGNYPNSSFDVTWKAIDENEMNEFVAPLQTLETKIVYSTHTVSGGKKGLTFEELRDRLISNAIGNPYVPISNVQIKTSLEDQNYEVVKNIDNITNRAFLASRDLPDPSSDKLITAASASIQTALFTMEEAVLVDTVIDNGDSITITPNTIFQNNHGKVTLLPSNELTNLLQLPPDQRAITVNNSNYFYTPFHYVLDASGTEFDLRPYYLDNPFIDSKVFIAENDTTKLQVTINSYRILKNDNGFKIQLELRSSEEFKALPDSEVFVQARYKPTEETDYAYLNATLIGNTTNGDRIYEFDVLTNFNVDKTQSLRVLNFLMYTADPKNLGCQLFDEFEILFATTYPMDITYKRNSVDDALGMFILPLDAVGISQEKLRIRFGYYLDKLWARSRTVVTPAAYAKYTTDEIKVYSEDVFEIDPNTGSTIFIEDGQVVRHKLHSAGDPILDNNGDPEYAHRKGDTIYDSDGQPVIASPRKLYRENDYMLIEGSYWFANDSVAVEYRSEMTSIFVDWITNSLEDISKRLIEQTKIYFYPKTTTGDIDVMVKDGVTTTIEAGQKFVLTLHVSGVVFKNLDLRNQLRIKAIEVINSQLKKTVISLSQMSKALTEAFGSDVIDVEIEGLGGSEEYATVTVMNETDRPSIKKILKTQSDNSLIVEEAVELVFIRHEIDEII